MKIKKLFKLLSPETIFRVFDNTDELIATGVVEDFLEETDSKFPERKIKTIKVLKNEKFQDIEDSDYLYLEIYVK